MTKLSPPDIAKLSCYQTEQLKRFRAKLSQAIATGDTEAVHDLRVASRRLHDALEVMGAYVGRKRVCQVQRSLKRIRRAFREVRDLDVLRISLCDAWGSGEAAANVQAEVEAVLARRRERASAAANRVGRRPKLVERVESVPGLCQAFARFARRNPAPLEEELKNMLRRRAAALLQEDPREEDTDLHAVRIRVKQMRYCAQLLEECGCLPAGMLTESLVQMQDVLGHWNDQIVATRILSRLAGRWRMISAKTAVSVRLLEYATLRAQAALDDRRKVGEQWPALADVVRASVSDEADDKSASVAAAGILAAERAEGDD